MEIIKSAAKLVFLMFAVTICVGFLVGKLPVDSFMILATGIFAFFYSNKGDTSKPYAGK